jgi:hydroxymethylglutaryl-CoA lyase
MEARKPLQVGVPNEQIYGMISEAGLPKGFSPATQWSAQ